MGVYCLSMLAYFSRGHDVIIIKSDLILRQKVRLGFFGNSLPPLLWVSWLTDLICGSLIYPLDYVYELNSVWYFYYSTSFLFFSMITFTTELKLAPQDVWLFTFTFTPEHSRADLGMRHKKNWLFVHCYRKWRCLNITDSEWLKCLINSMSMHHHFGNRYFKTQILN